VLFFAIFFRVSDPLSGANKIPAMAPTANPATTPKAIFPALILIVFSGDCSPVYK
jgi:hypothetical protein